MIVPRPSTLVAAFAAASLATSASAAEPRLPRSDDPRSSIYVGIDRQLGVRSQRVEGPEAGIEVDGRLTEAVWSRASVLTGFSQFAPADGRPADDSTQVLVWYSPTAIHFGIRAFEAHGAPNATLPARDRIFADDYIQILLGTFNDGRQAMVFSVNPLGVQADGIMNETGNRGAGSAREGVDYSADFVFESKGRVTDYGYEVEIRIPFKSIRYQPTDPQDWGLHVLRQVQHSGHEDSWAPARRDAASFLGQGGSITGLTGLRRGLVVDLIPSVVSRTAGAPGASGWNYNSERPDFGVSGRWGITNNLTLNGTANPDFSQVEADVVAVQYDPRIAVFVPERRPFFLEGLEQFQTPNNLIYSRRVVQPIAAAKLTGKMSGTNIAVLSAVDEQSASFSAGRCGGTATLECSHPVFNVVRMLRDFGRSSRVGFAYTDKVDGQTSNRVASVDSRVVFKQRWSTRLQGAMSRTWDWQGGTSYAATTAPLWDFQLRGDGRHAGITFISSGIHDDFRADAGFIPEPGVARLYLGPRYTWFGERGRLFESTTFSTSGDGTWKYQNFVRANNVRDFKLHFDLNSQLRGGWRAGLGLFYETFGFDPDLYSNLYLERTLASGAKDTVKYVGVSRLPNVDHVISFGTPQWDRFSANAFVLWGKDENFYEWASTEAYYATVNATYRPVDQLRFEGQYQLQRFDRRDDWSTVAVRHIPRLKTEYQLTRSIFLRMVGQYDMQKRDSLRDSQTSGFPLLSRSASGTFSRIPASERNAFRVDWLFSYQPNPGTVLFAGYGETQRQSLDLARREVTPLRRTDDGFFVKLSYLFRL